MSPHPLARIELPEWPPQDPSPAGDLRWLWAAVVGACAPWTVAALYLWLWS